MKRHHDAVRLDVAAFVADGAMLEGSWSGALLERLADSQSPPADAPLAAVRWQAQGRRVPVPGAEAESWLHLRAETTVWLVCQRCLQPMAEALAVDRSFRFVRSEAEAEALDAELDDDVLALSRSFDLRALVEDELLLALPLVPRHGTCPQPLPVGEAAAEPVLPAAEAAPHPFAALAALKKPAGAA